jgi:predicted nuclease of predicted toxin-antitoxin system
MKIRDFPLLTDENIAPNVVSFLRSERFDVLDVAESGWQSEDDGTLLAKALIAGRVVISQDGDFGTLTIRDGLPFVGIVRLRPGHITPIETISLLQQLLADNPEIETPFLIVVQLTSSGIRIRTR